MAEPSQYTFSLRDVAQALAREHGITEGRWALGFEFNMTVGTMGNTPAEAKPGAMLQIGGLNLTRATDAPADLQTVIDAADLGEPKRPARRRKSD